MQLKSAPLLEPLTIQKINAPDVLRQRLAHLGFLPQTPIHIVRKIGNTFIIQIRQSRLAIDAKMAQLIQVT